MKNHQFNFPIMITVQPGIKLHQLVSLRFSELMACESGPLVVIL